MEENLQLEEMRFFAKVIQAKSLALAARTMNVTPPAVSLRLKALETKLGTPLLLRTTRKMTLTEAGIQLAQGCERILAEVEALSESIRVKRQTMAGQLDVVATYGFGRRYIAPELAKFQAQHPELRSSLILSDRPLKTDGTPPELIIQVGALPNMALVAYPIADNRLVLCAAPSYLKKFGEPKSLQDLSKHRCFALRENDEDVTLWQFKRATFRESVRIHASMSSNDGEVVRDWTVQGLGIMVRSEWHVADDLRAGRLVELLPSYKLPDARVVALVPAHTGASRRAMAFIRHLQAQFRSVPPWRREGAAGAMA